MSTALAMTPSTSLPSVSGDIDRYLQNIRSIEILTAEQEQQLARQLRDNDDIDAAQSLVMSHLRFVVHIARSYSGYGLPLGDIIQEGNIGLMKAVRRFDPEVGVRLISFAVHWIRAEIHEFVIKNWRIVKVATTKPQRKLFFKLRSAKKQLGWFSAQEIQNVANDLGVEPKTVVEMESRLSGHDTSFDPVAGQDDDDQISSPSSWLAQDNADPALLLEQKTQKDSRHNQLFSALTMLDARSQDIVKRRWLQDKKPTLHELADEYSISAERIRQIEKNAMQKLKKAISDNLH